MRALLQYVIVLATGVAIGLCVHGTMRLEQFAKLPRIDEINILIGNSFAHPRPEATVILDDPSDERRVNEDLDYLIAKRTGTLEGWQAFSAAHAAGAHADSAEAEIDKLSLLAKTTRLAAAEVSDRVSPEAKVESDIAGASRPLEGRDHDRDCQGAPCNPSSNEIAHPTSESELRRLRPQIADLTDVSDTAPTPPIPAAKAGPGRGEKSRATALHREATVSSHIVPVHRRKTQPLPPVFMAVLGVETERSRRVIGPSSADPTAPDPRGRWRVAFSPE